MKRKQMLSALGIMLFVACSLAAQDKPGTIAALEFQKPKNEMCIRDSSLRCGNWEILQFSNLETLSVPINYQITRLPNYKFLRYAL